MKKKLSLVLTLVFCFSLCDCGGNTEEKASVDTTEATETAEQVVETISVNDLLSDTSNGAKAQLNVGKETTIYGRISSIGSDSCSVSLIQPKNTSVSVEMPIEQLAKLKVGQYVAIQGKVKSFGTRYTIFATETADLTLMMLLSEIV